MPLDVLVLKGILSSTANAIQLISFLTELAGSKIEKSLGSYKRILKKTIKGLKKQFETDINKVRQLDRILNNNGWMSKIIEQCSTYPSDEEKQELLIMFFDSDANLFVEFLNNFCNNVVESAVNNEYTFRETIIHNILELKESSSKYLTQILSILSNMDGKNFHQIAEILKILTPKSPQIPFFVTQLRRHEIYEPDFFRKKPLWVDFDEGFITEREEVQTVLQLLKKHRIILIHGEPASGKSIILKNIGYHLTNKSENVFLIESKEETEENIRTYFDRFCDYLAEHQSNQVETFLILDDAHLIPSLCSSMLKLFRNLKVGKILIGCRNLPKLQSHFPEFKFVDSELCLKIEGSADYEEMIKLYFQKNRSFEYSNEDIQKILPKFLKYKEDRWLLAWALKSYNKDDKEITLTSINQKILSYIKNDIMKTGEVITAYDILLIISVFYEYEISVERRFLINVLGLNDAKIEYLQKTEEILLKDEYIGMFHSVRAKLFSDALIDEPSLVSDLLIRYGFTKDQFVKGIFSEYIKSCPLNIFELIIKLLDEYGSYGYLVKHLDSIKNFIAERAKKAKDLFQLTFCFLELREYIEHFEILTLNILKERFSSERDFVQLYSSIDFLCQVDRNLAITIIESLDLRILLNMIETENSMKNIGSLLWTIFFNNENIGKQLIHLMDINKFKEKINSKAIMEVTGFLIPVIIADLETGKQYVDLFEIEDIIVEILIEMQFKISFLPKLFSVLAAIGLTFPKKCKTIIQRIKTQIFSAFENCSDSNEFDIGLFLILLIYPTELVTIHQKFNLVSISEKRSIDASRSIPTIFFKHNSSSRQSFIDYFEDEGFFEILRNQDSSLVSAFNKFFEIYDEEFAHMLLKHDEGIKSSNM